MLIRLMCESDLPEIMEIEEENFSVPWSKQSFRRLIHDPQAIFLVAAREDGLPVGTPVCMGFAGAVMAGEQGDVTNIAVRTTDKRQGIGRILLEALIRQTAAAGVRKLFLEVREHNTPALGLYRSSGFVQVGIRKNYYSDPAEDALVMKREVKGEQQ